MVDKEIIVENNIQNEIISLNFRGTRVQFHKVLLFKLPCNSPFNQYLQKNYDIDLLDLINKQIDIELLINRNVYLFNNILDYFENGELHFSHCLCLDVIQKELQFWGIKQCELAECCMDRLLLEKEENETKHRIGKEWNRMNKVDKLTNLQASSFHIKNNNDDSSNAVVKENRNAQRKCRNPLKKKSNCDKLHHILNNPGSSILAKIVAGIVVTTTILSVLLLSLETETFARHPAYEELVAKYHNQTGVREHGEVEYYFKHSNPEDWVFILDIILTVILTLDFVARFALNKDKCTFLCQPLSIVDLLGVLPVWVSLVIFIYITHTQIEHTFLTKVSYYIALLRALRIFRVGHIALHNKKLRVVFLALKCSWRELFILFTLIAINSFFYGLVMFYVEIWTADTFLTVFDAQWWAIITMTTVGYGDYFPNSAAGRSVGILCALTGIVVIAMATSVLVNNFLTIYRCVEKLERVETICSLKKNNRNDITDSFVDN